MIETGVSPHNFSLTETELNREPNRFTLREGLYYFPGKLCVVRDGTEINLTKQQNWVLFQLTKHLEEVLTYDELRLRKKTRGAFISNLRYRLDPKARGNSSVLVSHTGFGLALVNPNPEYIARLQGPNPTALTHTARLLKAS